VPPSAGKVPDRITCAVDLLDVRPDDQILEVGCGSVVAVLLAYRAIDRGLITAIDRRATAIDRARRHDAADVAAGRVVLERVPLAGFESATDANRIDYGREAAVTELGLQSRRGQVDVRPARRLMFAPIRYPERLEPLVRTIEDTPPGDIVAAIFAELRAGRSVDELLLASAFGVMRSCDVPPVHHGGPVHPIAGLHAIRHMATRLPGHWALVPVIQCVALANRHIQLLNCGPFILSEEAPVVADNSVESTLAALERNVRWGEFHQAERCFLHLLEVLPPMRVLEHLLQTATAKNPLDDHHLLYPVYTWRVIDYFGWDDAKPLVRPAVRFVSRPPGLAELEDLENIDGLIEEHGLLRRALRVETGLDETHAISTLSDDLGRIAYPNEAPCLLANALDAGLSLEGVGEALSLGASRLFLRSRTWDWDVLHANTTANVQRFLLRQPELSARTKLRALLVWESGPNVRLVGRQLAPDVLPDATRVASLGYRSQEALLSDIEDLLTSLPAQAPSPAAEGRRDDRDEIDVLVAMAQQYGDCGHDPAALIMTLGKVVSRDQSTEMHAYKHHQATVEEFYATRPSLRWTHLVAAAQGAALTRHRDDDIIRQVAESEGWGSSPFERAESS
jgi:hypothetical protein